MTLSPRRRWFAFAVLLIPVVVVSASTTALSFALPAISEALQPSGAELLWIIDIYPLVLAGLLIPMGSLGDRYGRRRLLLIGSAGFALVSLVAMLSPSPFWLILARGATAVFGSMLLPSTLALIRSIFDAAADRTRAVAVWTATFAAAAAIGPVLGGALLDHFPWEAVLLVGVPPSLGFLALAPWLLPEARDTSTAPIDIWSALLAIVTMLALVGGIKFVALGDRAWVGVIALVVGCGLAAIFLRRQRLLPHPMVDLTLFRFPGFGSGLAVNVLSNAAELGFIFMITLHLQIVTGMSPAQAGLAMLPPTALMVVSSLIAPRLVARLGAPVTIALGLAVSAAGYAIVAALGSTSEAWVTLVGFGVLGLGLGPAWSACTDLIISSAPVERAGSASSLSETAYEVGAVSGTAVVGGIVTALYQRLFVAPPGTGEATASAARETIGAAAHLAEVEANGAALLDAAARAFISAERITAAVMTAALALAALLILLGRRRTSARAVDNM